MDSRRTRDLRRFIFPLSSPFSPLTVVLPQKTFGQHPFLPTSISPSDDANRSQTYATGSHLAYEFSFFCPPSLPKTSRPLPCPFAPLRRRPPTPALPHRSSLSCECFLFIFFQLVRENESFLMFSISVTLPRRPSTTSSRLL